MHNKENSNNKNPRNMRVVEKAKDFKSAIKRLIGEIKEFRNLIIIALVLATIGSILSISAPNRLSKLTDIISKGLVINEKNLTTLNDNLKKTLGENINQAIAFEINEEKVQQIMQATYISEKDKESFTEALNDMSIDSSKGFISLINLPTSILEFIIPSKDYNGTYLSTSDKIMFLKYLNGSIESAPQVVIDSVFSDITIDDIKVSKNDQAEFAKIMLSINPNADINSLYKKIDLAPKSIRTLVEPEMNIAKIKSIVLILSIIYIVSALFNYIQSITMTIVSNNFAKILRNKISSKINRLPLKYFDNNTTGDILSRVTNDIDTIAQSLNQSLATLVGSLTLFIGSIIMMFYTNWLMALTAVFSSLIGFVLMVLILAKSQKYFTERQKELGNLNGHIEEVYSGLNVVKAYNGQKISNERFDLYNDKVYNANRKSQFLSGLMMPIMGFIGNLGYVAVCIVGALLVTNNYISFGVIIAFTVYVRLFTSPLSQIAQAFTSLQSTAASSERVFEFLDEPEMNDEKNITRMLNKKKIKGTIEFKNVTFKYDGNESPTIINFSAKAKTGQKVAIVGPTGAGKTTIVNLLMKFYEINEGDILIDGVSIKELSRENIHDLFTMVLQDTWLFNGTVKENIVYNRENIEDKKIEEICKRIGLDHFIRTLSDGYDSLIDDNDSVSAGQRQLLTLARGMVQNTPFLILDEATSNVDTRTEELVSHAMDKLAEGRTSFIIAHRLSTIKNANLILVMKDGNIIEQGTHNELMKKNGFYKELYDSQFEL